MFNYQHGHLVFQQGRIQDDVFLMFVIEPGEGGTKNHFQA